MANAALQSWKPHWAAPGKCRGPHAPEHNCNKLIWKLGNLVICQLIWSFDLLVFYKNGVMAFSTQQPWAFWALMTNVPPGLTRRNATSATSFPRSPQLQRGAFQSSLRFSSCRGAPNHIRTNQQIHWRHRGRRTAQKVLPNQLLSSEVDLKTIETSRKTWIHWHSWIFFRNWCRGKKISFGGIPNSSSLMPCLTTWAHSCSAVVLPMWTMSSPKGVQKQSHGCSCQGCKATNHSWTFRSTGTLRNPPEPTPAHTGTLRNLLEVASGTYTSTHQNSPEPASGTYTNQHTPELSGTCWNLALEPAPATRTGTHRSLSGLKTPLAYAVGEQKIKRPGLDRIFCIPKSSHL